MRDWWFYGAYVRGGRKMSLCTVPRPVIWFYGMGERRSNKSLWLSLNKLRGKW